MFDDVELLGELPILRWPLHPVPRRNERLADYIRRLAGEYDVHLATFCQRALGCSVSDLERCGTDPPATMLHCLARGTGLPVQSFRNLTDRRRTARWLAEVRWIGRRHPECVEEFDRMFPRSTR